MDKVNLLRDMPETTIEQLDEERFQLDRLKDAFNDAFKEHDELLLTEKEKEDSYFWFYVRDRAFTDCRIRLCRTRFHTAIAREWRKYNPSGDSRSSSEASRTELINYQPAENEQLPS